MNKEIEEKEDLLSCDNCKLKIARRNYVMHISHCSRHIEICKKCGDPIPKEKLSDHELTEHVKEDCPNCGKILEKFALYEHVKNDCIKRLITCVYCDLDLPFNDMTKHVEYCGTRTEKCNECDEFVMMKYKELHLDSNHKFLKLDEEPGPSASWELNKTTKPRLTKLNIPDKSDVTLLPCEFCDGMFTPNELRRHQVSCDNGWSTTVPILRRLSIIECNICKKSVASQDYDNHLIVCDKLENRNGNRNVDDKEEEGIPCLICKEQIQFDEYDRHYSRCSKNVKQSSSSSSSLSQRRKQETSLSSSSSSFSSNVFCEICKKFIRSEDYKRHVVNCIPSLSSSSMNNLTSLKLPCEFCLKLYSPEQLNSHQISCSKKFIGQSDTFIPCEICNELITINEFNEHQINCRVTNLF